MEIENDCFTIDRGELREVDWGSENDKMDNPDKFHKFDMVAYYIQNDNVSNLLIVQ
jgi:hypothetical protein